MKKLMKYMNSRGRKNRIPKVVKIKRHPFGKDYLAINLFGFIFTLRDLDPVELNHELIHSAQQRELLYLPFFIWYGIEWFILWLKYRDWTTAYFHISFEREAYQNQHRLNYLKQRRHWNYIHSSFESASTSKLEI